MPLNRRAEPFNHPDWLFEIKWDGFRSLAYIEHGRCRLVSCNGNEFKSFSVLNSALSLECRAKRAVLDGDIVCLDRKGNSQFKNLLFRRGEPRFHAFDLLSCNGEDLCYFPLADRKHRLRGVVPREAQRLLYCDHIEERGEHLFRLACKRDLEGIVAKRKFDPYLLDTRSGTRSGIATTRSGQGEKNCSSGNALPIPTGTTGTCVHQQVISSSKLRIKAIGTLFPTGNTKAAREGRL